MIPLNNIIKTAKFLAKTGAIKKSNLNSYIRKEFLREKNKIINSVGKKLRSDILGKSILKDLQEMTNYRKNGVVDVEVWKFLESIKKSLRGKEALKPVKANGVVVPKWYKKELTRLIRNINYYNKQLGFDNVKIVQLDLKNKKLLRQLYNLFIDLKQQAKDKIKDDLAVEEYKKALLEYSFKNKRNTYRAEMVIEVLNRLPVKVIVENFRKYTYRDSEVDSRLIELLGGHNNFYDECLKSWVEVLNTYMSKNYKVYNTAEGDVFIE